MLNKSLYGKAMLCITALLTVSISNAADATSPDSTLPIRKAHFPASPDRTMALRPVITANKESQAFINDYLTVNAGMLAEIQEKNPHYFEIMDSVFTRFGIPAEAKYLAIVESKLKTKIRSGAGAVGAWQLMPVTARYFKLRVNKYQDERTNFYKSTVAAAKYLTYLYKMFDDWLLVMAAYNGGPGTVFKAIKKSGSRNFWKMQQFLPRETRNHVKRFISTHYFYEEGGSIATQTKEEREQYAVSMEKWENRCLNKDLRD